MWQFVVLVEQTSIWSSVQTTSAKYSCNMFFPTVSVFSHYISKLNVFIFFVAVWSFGWADKHMKLCPDDICQMLPNKKTTSSQKGRANKFDEIERKQVTDLEQNEWWNWDHSFFSLVYHRNCANIGKEHHWTHTSRWTKFLKLII